MLRIGVDVGGTNTDAVVMDGSAVLAGVKAPTTPDVTAGVRQALEMALDQAGVGRGQVRHVMIGTTHFTNAVIERRHLAPTAIIRLGLPATACLPPMTDWPDDLRGIVGGHVAMLRGGHEFDGRVLSDLDEEGLDGVADEIGARGIAAAAITSVFSPINAVMERRARDRLLARRPGLRVVLSSDVGRLGLLERENATILNAALLGLAGRTVAALGRALRASGLGCGFSITQNDGTLMAADRVRRMPVLTFASGPTNSMRGAAFLTGLSDAIVVDVGGTTADVGALVGGFPRPAATATDMGGVRTNFRMPDVMATGLGGGSLVSADGTAVGPRSVGYRLAEEALAFGGGTLTATDVAVRLGLAEIGDASKVAHLDAGSAARAMATMHAMLERAVDRARTSAAPVPVIAVGGGSFLVPDRLGGLDVVRPQGFALANAVGAAIAQVSGEVDRIVDLSGSTRGEGLRLAEAEARARAVAAGARPDGVAVIEREDIPLAYLPGRATRIRVRVAGDMEA